MTNQDEVRGWEKEFDKADLKDWITDHHKELDPDKVKDFIRTILANKREEATQLKKPDLDLTPGFQITAEYRLGEIRGRNQAIDDIIKILS